MRVSGFMVPAEKVVTATPNVSVREVMDLMLLNKVGAIVIVHTKRNEVKDNLQLECTDIPVAVGIITKSDILQAYRDRVDIDDPCHKIMGDRKLVSCHPGDDRDIVARILQKNHTHHVVVVDEHNSHFVGIVSSWDVASECAKDSSVWPYLRGEDGKVSMFPVEKVERGDPLPAPYDPHKPTSIMNHDHNAPNTFMDDLDLEAFQ